MPGPTIRDVNAPKLLDAVAISGTGTTTGSAVTVDKPGDVAFHLNLASVSGTNPTFDVEIQGSNVSNFATKVSYGRFAQKAAAGDFYLAAPAYFHKYVRAVLIAGGTSPAATATVTVEPEFTALDKNRTA